MKYDAIIDFYTNYFYMEGKYYLLKLNISEVMEHLNQFNNIFSIYNCSLSVGYAWTIYIVLAIESLHNAYVLFRGKINGTTRDHQAMIDLFVDFLYIVSTLCIILWNEIQFQCGQSYKLYFFQH